MDTIKKDNVEIMGKGGVRITFCMSAGEYVFERFKQSYYRKERRKYIDKHCEYMWKHFEDQLKNRK